MSFSRSMFLNNADFEAAVSAYNAGVFLVAESAHATGDDDYVREQCEELAVEFNMTSEQVYKDAEAAYNKHFGG